MGIFFKKLYKFLKILILVALIALIIKAFAIDAFQIPSISMENTLMPGDFILANKFAYHISTPRAIPIADVPIPQYKMFEIGKPEINDVIILRNNLGVFYVSIKEYNSFYIVNYYSYKLQYL